MTNRPGTRHRQTAETGAKGKVGPPAGDVGARTGAGIDALLPEQMAHKAEQTGAYKARMPWPSLLTLSVLGGAFIGIGALFAMAVTANLGPAFSGIAGIVGGIAFATAFVLVVVGGAELFTSNNLMVMALVSRHIRAVELLRAWAIVYVGNLIGTVGTAVMVVLAGLVAHGDTLLADKATATAAGMAGLAPIPSLFRSILGNVLVCLAVWLTYSARTSTDRILCVILPISAFYALSLEHVIATMFYFPLAYVSALEAGTLTGIFNFPDGHGGVIGLGDFSRHLLAVTTGNIIGGGVLVGAVYWFIYRRPRG